MTILCIETATSVCSAAICKDGLPIKQCICYENANHARQLPLFIDQLIRYARAEHMTIDAIALSEGPGSYTGLRIGTSTAKGLCYGMNIPLIAVPTMDILIRAAKAHCANQAGVYLPMIDARRMEVYTLNGEGKACAIVVESEDSVMEEPDGETQVVYYFGDGAAKCQAVFNRANWHYIPDIVPQAQYMGELAERSGKGMMDTALAYYEPFYLKDFVAAPSHVKGLV